MAEEAQTENLGISESTSTVAETQEATPETHVAESTDVSKEESKPNLYDNKEFREEADKIRESTKHKVSKKYESDLKTERDRIAELESKIDLLSSPPDNESVYDERIGDWRAKNMSVDEYQGLLRAKEEEQKTAKQQQEWYKPMEERTAKICQSNDDFQPSMTNAVRSGVLDQNLVLLAAQEDGGLELLYDLVKENSPKLNELRQLPADKKMRELYKLTWAKQQAPVEKATQADDPVTPETTTDSGNKDYASMNYRDGYQEYLKNKSRGRG